MTIFKSTLLAIMGMFVFMNSGMAQSPLIQNVYNREALSLNGDWNYIVDPYENGYYDYRRAVQRPHIKTNSTDVRADRYHLKG